MSKQIFIIPKTGVQVVDPLTRKPIDSNGQYVEKTTYWARRILSGDVIQYGPDEMKKSVEEKQPVEEVFKYQDENEDQQFEEVGGDQ